MNIIEELKYRNLLHAVTDESVEQRLQEDKMTFYIGADPTSDSLHIGHLVPYMIAMRLVERGHKPILVVGGGTGLIGDPSGRSSERNLLTLEETLKNAEAISAQVRKLLPKAKVVNNYDWLKRYDMISFLRDVGKHFNINQMMAKDSVKSRLETGISYTEFSYQIIQAMDFFELYQHENCKLQVGGQDQWGNITAGLDYIRKNLGAEEEAFGLVAPLLLKKDGTKFGKTAEGAVWLDPEKTSPYAFYQYWINLEDDEAILRLKQFTAFTKERIEEIEESMQDSPHLRHAQKALAGEVTRLVHGEDGLEQAEKITRALFQNDIASLTKEEIAMGLEGVPSVETGKDLLLVDALVETSLASSKRDARTLIKQNAVSVNGDKTEDLDAVLKKNSAIEKTYHVLRRGKKHYALIKHL